MAKKKIDTLPKQQSSQKLKAFKRDLYDDNKRLIFVAGLPCTGKTYSAIEAGIEQVLNGKYRKLIIIRPILDNGIGYLPGEVEEKMFFFTRQSEIYINNQSQVTYDELIRTGKLEVLPATMLQGNRFDDSFVIIDEAQNIHKLETFKILSRVGYCSKFVIISDISKGQAHKKIDPKDSMPVYSMAKFTNKEYVGVHSFYDNDDVLGDTVTKDIILTLMDDFI